MRGLTVRWSLKGAPADVEESLASSVAAPCELVAVAAGPAGLHGGPADG